MAANLVLSGGPGHDFDATTGLITTLLAEVGISSTVVTDPHEAVAALTESPQAWDLLTVNALRWQMGPDRDADQRRRWSFTLDPWEGAVIERFVRRGGGLLACHTAAICFDAEPGWAACLGATWSWEHSSHPPLGPAVITPTSAGRAHPVTAGLDGFTTLDEVYCSLDGGDTVDALLTSAHDGTDHPVLWARTVGRGRVVVDLLGHDAAAVGHRTHAEILRRAGRWLTESESEATVGASDPSRSDTTP